MNENTLGKNVRLFRKHKNLKMKNLADISGIPVNTLGRIERGENSPSIDLVARIAKYLNIPIGYLFNETEASAYLVHFSSQDEQYSFESFDVDMKNKHEDIVSIYARLENLCSANHYHFFPLDFPLNKFSKSDIKNAAMMARSILGIGDSIIFDLVNVLEANGIRIIFMDMSDNIKGFSFYTHKNKCIAFFINSNKDKETMNFTLAHELGQVIFHQGCTKHSICLSKLTKNELEKAADYFAEYFLMPDFIVNKTIQQLGTSPKFWPFNLIVSVKSRFGVSTIRFLERLLDLDLIDEERKSDFTSQVSDYYKKNNKEPGVTGNIMNINRRLSDLLLIGRSLPEHFQEVRKIKEELVARGVSI